MAFNTEQPRTCIFLKDCASSEFNPAASIGAPANTSLNQPVQNEQGAVCL
jgi:hypothetical protein